MGEIVRLQKYIAMSGVASRRAAETMIQEGRVKEKGKKKRKPQKNNGTRRKNRNRCRQCIR